MTTAEYSFGCNWHGIHGIEKINARMKESVPMMETSSNHGIYVLQLPAESAQTGDLTELS